MAASAGSIEKDRVGLHIQPIGKVVVDVNTDSAAGHKEKVFSVEVDSVIEYAPGCVSCSAKSRRECPCPVRDAWAREVVCSPFSVENDSDLLALDSLP